MKKAWLIVALVALGGLAVNTFADVQNIRLSGDIRMRGYYLYRVDDNNHSDTSFISQRTRVSVEADLEDHVLVVVTLKAESLWGADDESFSTSGAGSQQGNFNINRVWDVGINEAYVQFNEVFYTAATLKLGRQYLHYGRGLILSSVEQEYNFDAARLVLDYYPLTIDIVGAKIVERSSFGSNGGHGGTDLLFINARYEMSDSLIKNVEAYFGWLSQADRNPPIPASSRVPPSTGGASPVILGLRSDMNLTEGLNTWVEAAFEFGGDGPGVAGNGIEAFLLNAGGRFTFSKDSKLSPAINANYIYASGGGGGGEHNFRPWFDYADGYNGYIFAPSLSNIHIFNVGVSVKPSENTSVSLQGYYYLKVDDDSPAGSNSNVDFGGFGPSPGNDSELGFEGDVIVAYDYSKDVRFQLVAAAFLPGDAFTDAAASTHANRTAAEIRGEVNVKF